MKSYAPINDDKDLVTKEYVDIGLESKVDSVNGETGIVVLTTDDVSATDNNRYVPSVPVTNAEVSYLNGNGQFVPIAVGGASSIANMFLSNTTSAIIGTYKTLHYTSPDVGVTEISVNVTKSADVLSAVYLYNAPIGVDIIDGGVWESTFYMKSSSTVGINRLKIVCFMRAVDGTETELFTKYTNSVNGTNYAYYYTETTRNYFNVDPTSYLGFKIYGNTNRTSTVTIYYSLGGEKASYINSPLALRHNQVRDLNGDSNYQHITSTQVDKLNGIESGAQVNTVTGVKGDSEVSYRAGNINITKDNIGLGNVTNESKATMFTSPSFTGKPVAPTASVNTSTTQIATTAFVNNEIANDAPAETSQTIGNLVNSSTAKTIPVDNDMIPLMDSASSNIIKKLSWTNMKSVLNSYFSTIFSVLGHTHIVSNITDLTATASELNTLDGITATTTELNYTDGVTSNIQTQLNNKSSVIPFSSTQPSSPSIGDYWYKIL